MRFDGILIAFIAFLTIGVFFGGGTESNLFSELVVRLACLPLLAMALSAWFRLPDRDPRLLLFWLVPTGFAMLQLVPLPIGLWGSLPQHTLPEATFRLLPQPGPTWFQASMVPDATRLTLFGLLPATATFFTMLLLDWDQRRMVFFALVGLGCICIGLGFLQSGESNSLAFRFYSETNMVGPIGFFANRNHFAAFLYSLTVVLIYLMTDLIAAMKTIDYEKHAMQTVIIVFLLFVTFLTAFCQSLVGSRMGLFLEFAAIGICCLLNFSALTKDLGNKSFVILAFVAVAGVVVFFIAFGLDRFADRLAGEARENSRFQWTSTALQAAWAFFPFGSGLGSFDRIYAMFEPKESLLPGLYVRHGHNDYVELIVETGVFGLAWMAVFFAWFARQVTHQQKPATVTRRRRRHEPVVWGRAGAVIIVLILVHCVVDYPLRTQTMDIFFALACGLMVEPLRRTPSKDLA